MTIMDFLLARIAGDEAVARAATPGPWETMTEETADGENIYYTVEHGRAQLCDMSSTSMQGRSDAEHIARHDPARVLAECAAKRAIVEQWNDPASFGPFSDAVGVGIAEGIDTALRALAAVYTDHPDYRQEWAS